MSIVTGDTEFFKGIGQVKYEGLGSDNPLAFRWYDADKVVPAKHERTPAFRSGLLAFVCR
jgi:xylose isomerase